MGVLISAVCQLSASSITTLTFEGMQDQEQILDYYDGGLGGDNSGPGPSYGITFGPYALALISDAQGGSGNFSGQPSGKTALFFQNQPSVANDVMNVAGGFSTGLSFYYTAIYAGGTVQVYSGANGTGSLLATLVLPQTPSTPGTPPCNSTDAFCPWEPFGASFSGTAHSVVFAGAANQVGFDNLTLGSVSPVSTPEPESAWLLVIGGALLFQYASCKRKAP
jgi:hypothetical protein